MLHALMRKVNDGLVFYLRVILQVRPPAQYGRQVVTNRPSRYAMSPRRGLISQDPYDFLLAFDVDVLVCPECRGRLRILGQVTDEATVGRMLAKLGMPAQAPRAARARDPTDLLGDVVADP